MIRNETCECNECKERFKEDDLVRIYYGGYAGASLQESYVSPCCNAAWEYAAEA